MVRSKARMGVMPKTKPTDEDIKHNWIAALRMMVEELESAGYTVTTNQILAAINYSSAMPDRVAKSSSEPDLSFIRYHSAMDFISGWDAAMIEADRIKIEATRKSDLKLIQAMRKKIDATKKAN